MPPLSAYTPLESLLFFQSLAALDKRPSSFVSISDLLRNNKFVRENGASDAHRLSPGALEDLYTTLMCDDADSPSSVSTHELNGRHPDAASPSNPKKRKIMSPRPDGLSDGTRGHANFVPGLVSRLYASYKELVTKEIRSEEKRFQEIRDEIERLQMEEHESPAPKIAHPIPPSVPQPKHESAPEPMDLDSNEKPVEQARSPTELKPAPVEPTASVGAKPPQIESQHKDQPQPPPQTVPQPTTPEVQPPAQPVQLPPEPQTKNQQPQLQPQPQPHHIPPQQQPLPPHPIPQPQPQPQPQLQPQPQPQPQSLIPPKETQPAAANLPQPQLPNGKAPRPLQQAEPAPRNVPTQENLANVPSPQPKKPLSTTDAPTPSSGPGRAPLGAPLQPVQMANQPAPSPQSQKAPSTAKTPAKKATSTAPVPAVSPRLPPQSSFQQWSLHQPQTPQQHPSLPVSEPSSRAKPPLPPPTQQTPKVEKKAQKASKPVVAPSTPQPTAGVLQMPAPVPHSGLITPVGPVHSPAQSGERGSKPRLSIQTPGSLTPWKRAPHLTLPHSPRSPDRPRPEDVSPISEKAPSPFGSREATPEEPEPPRRRGPGRGRKKAADVDQGAAKRKGEKPTVSAGKKRDRSTGSPRSRGRSIVSRDDESEIKREMPSTPADITDSVEPDRSGQKGATTSESRPGRGRPKRKRAPSEVPEPEPHQPDIHQLTRVDPNQSTPYVVCARNFPRTGAPIMNDVTTHKHASIFTKPLTERDAPGYRDLIYRPQDLKSIKSAIHQGSRALAAATEAANTPVADGESPAPNAATPSKNAVLLLQKTEDVMPPKAIVNSTQLEKELIRMFANAVMFNPIPQRGFGPAFPMIGDGGSRRRLYAPEIDEGGIINDTREMFEDVEQAVTRWRAAERTADELASKSVLALRRESASDPNMDSADDVKG
ncbi:uncharacterized protein BJX67DRAFT_340287 [Aspergillus lucknowensis]|uniref:Bromo domain-containing protein n=1 Tax=Aspergillus lucknowensis TaxID=176173 RepID=A0ABR4M840_9EURO